MFILISILIVMILVGFNFAINVYNSDYEKISAYECGSLPRKDARQRFNIQFYIIALLFLLFDLEIVLLIPYATIASLLSWLGYWVFSIVLGILTFGLVFELKQLLPNK